MKTRISTMVGQAVEGMPWLGTFHAIGVRILRRHAEMIGLKPDFTILDVDDQIRLLKQILEAENIDEKRWPARVLAGVIDDWKNRGLTPDKVPPGEGAAFAAGRGIELYAAYQARLKVLNAADFGDLLLENIRLFREHPEVLRQYQDRFRYILVDEYQDTNVAQYLWLRLLAQRPSRANLTSGTRFRRAASSSPTSAASATTTSRSTAGAAPRSTTSCASRRIFPAPRSSGWSAITARPATSSPPPRTSSRTTKAVSARRCAPRTSRARRSPSPAPGIRKKRRARSARRSRTCSAPAMSLDEIAILVRASFQMREFEDRFVTLGLPYRVIGGPRFYERAEIRDALAYLRVVNSPADDLAFERIVNVPRRGLGDATVQLLHDHARANGVPLFAAARALVETEELKSKPRAALRDCRRVVRPLARAARCAAA